MTITPVKLPDGKTQRTIPAGTDAGSPVVWIFTDVIDGTQLTLQFVNVSKNEVVFQAGNAVGLEKPARNHRAHRAPSRDDGTGQGGRRLFHRRSVEWRDPRLTSAARPERPPLSPRKSSIFRRPAGSESRPHYEPESCCGNLGGRERNPLRRLTHSAVVFFIKDFALRHDLRQERFSIR